MTKYFRHKMLIICILQCVLAKLYFATILFQFWHGICQVNCQSMRFNLSIDALQSINRCASTKNATLIRGDAYACEITR